jgi:hypothetical protein
MTRRLLLSYLTLTALILLFLEVPLRVVYARRERDTLVATARRDASALAVAAGESLETPPGHNLTALASSIAPRRAARWLSTTTGATRSWASTWASGPGLTGLSPT